MSFAATDWPKENKGWIVLFLFKCGLIWVFFSFFMSWGLDGWFLGLKWNVKSLQPDSMCIYLPGFQSLFFSILNLKANIICIISAALFICFLIGCRYSVQSGTSCWFCDKNWRNDLHEIFLFPGKITNALGLISDGNEYKMEEQSVNKRIRC